MAGKETTHHICFHITIGPEVVNLLSSWLHLPEQEAKIAKQTGKLNTAGTKLKTAVDTNKEGA